MESLFYDDHWLPNPNSPEPLTLDKVLYGCKLKFLPYTGAASEPSMLTYLYGNIIFKQSKNQFRMIDYFGHVEERGISHHSGAAKQTRI